MLPKFKSLAVLILLGTATLSGCAMFQSAPLPPPPPLPTPLHAPAPTPTQALWQYRQTWHFDLHRSRQLAMRCARFPVSPARTACWRQASVRFRSYAKWLRLESPKSDGSLSSSGTEFFKAAAAWAKLCAVSTPGCSAPQRLQELKSLREMASENLHNIDH